MRYHPSGRKNDVLKAWLFIKRYGLTGLSRIIDKRLKLRDYIVDQIKNHNDFELISEPEFFNICFYSKNVDAKTRRYDLIKKGVAMVNYSTTKEGKNFYRLTLANNNFTEADADKLLSLLV